MMMNCNSSGFRCLLFSALWLFSLNGAFGATIQNAFYQRMQVEDFASIREYFSGIEHHPRKQMVVRTTPEAKNGLYFVLELSAPAEVRAVRLSWIPSNAKDITVIIFELEGAPSGRELLLGLTGTDEPVRGVRPLAWKIDLLGEGGTVLDSHESFLWRMP